MEAGGNGSERDRMMDGLLAVRADAQSLLVEVTSMTKRIEDATALEAGAARAQVAAIVAEGRSLLARRHLGEHWHKINTAREQEPSLGRIFGDELEKVLNAIEDLRERWPTSDEPGRALTQSKKAAEILGALIQAAAGLTIPARLQDHLRQRTTGRALDFHATFSDEMPDDAARTEYLAELKEYEGRSLGGVVDVETGLIYVTSPSRAKRILSYFAPFLTAAALGALLYLVSLLDIDWPLAESEPLLEGYILVLAGMVAHLLVENAKQLEMSHKIIVVGDKLTWMHLHWVSLSWSIVPAAITAVGLRFGGIPGAENWETFLFAGYAADSVAGLFLTRYDAEATKISGALREALKPKPAVMSAD